MSSMIKKSFNAPEEIRHFDKGMVEVFTWATLRLFASQISRVGVGLNALSQPSEQRVVRLRTSST
jgi:hypothetical protein